MAKRTAKGLVVVESPAKARTISRILGSEYDVRASVGHVRDLPKSDLGVDIENGFQPKYVIPREKSKAVKEIKQAVGGAPVIYLATDPDREGEAIAWHLIAAAGLEGKPVHRVVFHEITPEAVRQAFEDPREINLPLVDAQQARRVLDRLVGYRLSPFLWKQVRRGLSAGRVQSVALRLVAEREREIQAFVPQEYWTIDTELARQDDTDEQGFRARLAGYVEDRKRKLEIGSQTEADRITSLLKGAAYGVLSVQQKTQTRRPAPPFITSTLQQEASRRLGFSAKRTMAVAQQLYEGLGGSLSDYGLITYMRTDSTNIAGSAMMEAREYIGSKFGGDFLPPSPRAYTRKVKGAQEAHEAIRPTSVMRDPDTMRSALDNDQLRLYTLIWQRFVASQMADAKFDQTTAEIQAAPASGEEPYLLRATNTQLRFAGYRQVYEERKDNGDEDEALGTNPLPDLSAAAALRMLQVLPDQHFTEPPPRFTEASLVKALEEKGIGRPSTYAPTMATVQDRGYVEKEGRALKPTDLGFIVNDLLVQHFPDFVDEKFTAEMESELDEVAGGERDWVPVVEQFYRPLEKALDVASEAAPQREVTDEKCELCGKPMIVRWGRRGKFLACSGFPECRNTKSLGGEEEPEPEPTDEKCDECGSPMVIRTGRYGRFLACTRYPECKGRRAILTKVGVPCPKDGGEIVERRSKKGRTFYGCANYPKCDFVVWNRPLSQPCPQCGGLLTQDRQQEEGKQRAKCTACDWKGEVTEELEPAPTTA